MPRVHPLNQARVTPNQWSIVAVQGWLVLLLFRPSLCSDTDRNCVLHHLNTYRRARSRNVLIINTLFYHINGSVQRGYYLTFNPGSPSTLTPLHNTFYGLGTEQRSFQPSIFQLPKVDHHSKLVHSTMGYRKSSSRFRHSYISAMRSISISNPPPPTSHPLTALPAHSTNLVSLPTELVIEIFKAVDSFDTAATLSKSSRRLRGIWKLNADAILPSVVECFPQARELAHAQEEARAPLRVSPPPSWSSETAQRISSNATLISLILPNYESRVIRASALRGARRAGLTRKERADFIRASYRAMTMAAADRPAVSHSVLAQLDMLEYMQLKETTEYLYSWFKKGSEIWRPNHIGAAPALLNASIILSEFHCDLIQVPLDHDDFLFWKPLPFGYFLVADGYQKKAGPASGARLADLLPLAAQKSIFTSVRRYAA